MTANKIMYISLKKILRKFILAIAMISLTLVLMAFFYWSAKSKALFVCGNYFLGDKFNLVDSFSKNLHKNNNNHYTYIFISGYSEAFSCEVYVDDSSVVIATQVIGPSGEIEK